MPESSPFNSELVPGVEIDRANLSDIGGVWEVINKCSDWLKNKGLAHWSNHYSREMVSKMIRKQQVYLATKNGDPVSTITFDMHPPKYYVTDKYLEKFTDPGESAGYIMAVGVLPEFQGNGLAVKMLDFSEGLAIKEGAKWLRLDCRDEVEGLTAFYERRGYKKFGDKAIVEGENETYWLMEKQIQ